MSLFGMNLGFVYFVRLILIGLRHIHFILYLSVHHFHQSLLSLWPQNSSNA